VVVSTLTTFKYSTDPKCGNGNLPGHDGQEVQRKGGHKLLPRPGRQSGVRLHQAPADHVRRSVPGRIQLQWPGQHGAMPQHGRQSGVGLRCGGAFSLNISFGFCLLMLTFILQEKWIRHTNTGQCLQRATRDDANTPLLRPAATERASSG